MRHAGDVKLNYTTGRFVLSGDLRFLQFSGGKGTRTGTGLSFLETFPSGLESWEFIQLLQGGWVILMSNALMPEHYFWQFTQDFFSPSSALFEETSALF